MPAKKYIDTISKLASVQRYSDHRLVNDESVLEHTGFVGMLAMFVGRNLQAEGFEINFESLLSKALLHDIDEVITGDIAMPIKYFSIEMRNTIGQMENEMVSKLSKELGDQNSVYSTWIDAKAGKEGAIVSMCDLVAVLYKIHDESVMRGNKTVVNISIGLKEKLYKKGEEILKFLDSHSTFVDDFVMECYKIIDEIQEIQQ